MIKDDYWPKMGDIRFDKRTGKRKRFNGAQWRELCRIDDCPLASAFNGLCRRHQNLKTSRLIRRRITEFFLPIVWYLFRWSCFEKNSEYILNIILSIFLVGFFW